MTSSVAEVVVAGVLEDVDVESGRYRLRDDMGNAIDLEQVDEPSDVAWLVGGRVTATGPATRDSAGHLRLGAGTRLVAVDLPAEWSVGHRVDWADALTGPSPDVEGVEGLTGDDVEQFLADLRR